MDKATKKRIKQAVSWIALAALVALLAVMPLLAQKEAEADGPVASILSATATVSDLEISLRGGGTLAAGNAETVNLPSGVKITEYLVKNGETVTEGTPVAAVDKVSLMTAIVQVEETLEYLRKEITSASDDTISSYLTAKAGGLVKEIYAQPGDSVADVMLKNGALAVLSLDGRMAVQLTRDTDLAAGDTVTVTFASGKEVSGRVDSSLNGKITVSMEDDNYEIGETVAVTTRDGDRLGTGELQVSSAWKITGYTGTIQTVHAVKNREVSDGARLFTLTDTDFTGTRDTLASLHRDYEELLQDMFQMYETGYITAPCDGLISGVDEDSEHLLAAMEGEQGWFVDLLDAPAGKEKTWTVMLLSGETICDGTDTDGTKCTAEEHMEGCYYFCTGKATCTAKKHQATCLALCVSSDGTVFCPALNHKADCIEKCGSCDTVDKCAATGAHKPTCIESCISADGITEGKTDCPATKHHKTDCLESCTGAADCPATVHHQSTCLTHCDKSETCTASNHQEGCYMTTLVYTAYAAYVRDVGTSELLLRQDTATLYTLKTGKNGWELVNPSTLNTSTFVTEGQIAVANPSAYKPGDVILFWKGYQGEVQVKSGISVYTNIGAGSGSGSQQGGFPGMGDLSGLLAGMFGGMGGFPGMGSMGGSAQQFTLFDLNGTTLMTVTEQDVMSLNIAIDEQDISDLSLGQSARVEIAALKGQTFEAEVTDIALVGTNNGGSSKFTVELTIPLEEGMLAGMNATAAIPLYTKMDAVTIPAAALVETSGGTVVYTALDPESGEPASPVSVKTGISDGETVEILEGLKSGDSIYYSYYDTLELDHTAKTEFSWR